MQAEKGPALAMPAPSAIVNEGPRTTSPNGLCYAIDLTRQLRTAAALCRDFDWRAIVHHYEDHAFKPLAALADAARDALFSFPPHQIGPAQVAGLADPMHAPSVVDLLSMFGCPP